MGKKKLDREEILGMYDSGLTVDGIAKAIGCYKTTVTDILRINGRTGEKMEEKWKCPIHPNEIQRLKDRIRIGQTVWIEVEEADKELRTRKKDEKCRVVGKYPHLILAKNSKGTRRTITYAELAIRERQMGT